MAVRLFKPGRIGDSRGWFSEVYSEVAFAARGVDCRFVQDNHSLSRTAGTVRGLHFQRPPHAQAKLVRCVAGRIFDVAVDIRRGSPTYGRWVGAELSAENGLMMFVPVGFAHGFATLTANCEVCYKVSAPYARGAEGGLRWDDPGIGVVWQLPTGVEPTLSEADRRQPSLAAFDSPFDYDGEPLSLTESPLA